VAGKRRENREIREKLGKTFYVVALRQLKRKLLRVRFFEGGFEYISNFRGLLGLT